MHIGQSTQSLVGHMLSARASGDGRVDTQEDYTRYTINVESCIKRGAAAALAGITVHYIIFSRIHAQSQLYHILCAWPREQPYHVLYPAKNVMPRMLPCPTMIVRT